ncbi:MAG: caspase family protein [Planctomycetota bacterium]
MRKLSLVCCLLFVARVFAADAVWHPQKTWVFAVGVLAFDDKSYATWPDKGRQDAVMIDAFKKRGVPADQIVFIKNTDATKANVTASLNAFLAKPAEGDTLIFYYAGHGGRDMNDPKRTAWFVPYDTKSSWKMGDVCAAIEKNFKGSNVLLTADCCHSGALAIEAGKRGGRINYGVLTSAFATTISTGNWTFTQCLINVLNGNPALDANGDGKITFGEAAQYCENEMAFFEGQLSCSAAKGHFSTDLVLAKNAGPKQPRVGELCEAMDTQKWWKVKILDSRKGEVFVTWLGWEKKWDRWIDEKQVRPYTPPAFKTGAVVEVESGGKWYAAKVIDSKLGLNRVHYDGYPDADDEWVVGERVRVK